MDKAQLFNAALEGNQDTLEQYQQQNQDTGWDSIRDENGNTLIAAAASRGKLHIIQYLHGQGASLNLPNNDNRVDVQIAYEDGHPNTARGLIALYEQGNLDVPLQQEAREALDI